MSERAHARIRIVAGRGSTGRRAYSAARWVKHTFWPSGRVPHVAARRREPVSFFVVARLFDDRSRCIRPGSSCSERHDLSYALVRDPMPPHDLQATILRCLEIETRDSPTGYRNGVSASPTRGRGRNGHSDSAVSRLPFSKELRRRTRLQRDFGVPDSAVRKR